MIQIYYLNSLFLKSVRSEYLYIYIHNVYNEMTQNATSIQCFLQCPVFHTKHNSVHVPVTQFQSDVNSLSIMFYLFIIRITQVNVSGI